MSIFTGWAREYGDIFYYRAAWLHVYFLNHPDLIEEVLVRNPRNFLKDRVVRKSRWFFGEGLLTNEGDSWLRQRKLSAPAFHRERVSSYAGVMTDYAGQMLAAWREGEILGALDEAASMDQANRDLLLIGREAPKIGLCPNDRE